MQICYTWSAFNSHSQTVCVISAQNLTYNCTWIHVLYCSLLCKVPSNRRETMLVFMFFLIPPWLLTYTLIHHSMINSNSLRKETHRRVTCRDKKVILWLYQKTEFLWHRIRVDAVSVMYNPTWSKFSPKSSYSCTCMNKHFYRLKTCAQAFFLSFIIGHILWFVELLKTDSCCKRCQREPKASTLPLPSVGLLSTGHCLKRKLMFNFLITHSLLCSTFL